MYIYIYVCVCINVNIVYMCKCMYVCSCPSSFVKFSEFRGVSVLLMAGFNVTIVTSLGAG